MIRREMSDARMDRYLIDLFGFHQLPRQRVKTEDLREAFPRFGSARFEQRPWGKLNGYRDLDDDQVIGMEPSQMHDMLLFVAEVEAPIKEYTQISGESLSVAMPRLASFLGKDAREWLAVGKIDNTPWCESSWCADEKRHANHLKRILEALVGRKVEITNPKRKPTFHTREPEQAIAHVRARETAERAAAASYMIMAVHSRGPLRQALFHIMRDEIKHLAIVGAGHRFLTGYRPNRNLVHVVKRVVAEAIESARERTNATKLRSLGLGVELLVTHLLVEVRLRRYLRRLPLSVLRQVFDGGTRRTPPNSIEGTAEQEAELGRMKQDADAKRRGLFYWGKSSRREALAQERYEEEHPDVIADAMRTIFPDGLAMQSSNAASVRRAVSIVELADLGPWASKAERPKLRAALLDRIVTQRIRENSEAMSFTSTAECSAARGPSNGLSSGLRWLARRRPGLVADFDLRRAT